MLDYKGEVSNKMKIMTNKNFVQKLIIMIVAVTLINFGSAPTVKASVGGELLTYMRDFVTFIGDVRNFTYTIWNDRKVDWCSR